MKKQRLKAHELYTKFKKSRQLHDLSKKGVSGKALLVGSELQVFTYYTDGGILDDDTAYSMLTLFKPKDVQFT